MSQVSSENDSAATEVPAPAQQASEQRTPEVRQEQDHAEHSVGAGREAAKYRRQLRETEAERDGLRESLTRVQRAEAERLGAQRLSQPADLWTFGAELSDVLDDSGNVQSEAVQAAVERLLSERPGLERGAAVRFPSLGQGRREPVASGPTWSDLFKMKH